MKGLHIHKDAPFLADLVSEMMSFPVGVHDDQVDALGLAGQLIDRLYAVSRPKVEKPAQVVHTIDDLTLPPREPAKRGRR